jgi:hypothetical protein
MLRGNEYLLVLVVAKLALTEYEGFKQTGCLALCFSKMEMFSDQ